MFHQRDDNGVEYPAFLGRGLAAGELQERQITQVHMSQDFVGQVEPAHADLIGGAPADLGTDLFFAFTHQTGSQEKTSAETSSGVKCDLSAGMARSAMASAVQPSPE